VFAAGVVAGVQRALDLAGRHRVHLHAQAAQQPQHVRVGAGLLREADGVEHAQPLDAVADGAGVVDPQRRGMGLRQRLQALGGERGGGGVLERRHARMVHPDGISVQCFGLPDGFIFDMVERCPPHPS